MRLVSVALTVRTDLVKRIDGLGPVYEQSSLSKVNHARAGRAKEGKKEGWLMG